MHSYFQCRDKDFKIKDINSKDLEARIVFSLVIKYLKDDFFKHTANGQSEPLEDSDVYWVSLCQPFGMTLLSN